MKTCLKLCLMLAFCILHQFASAQNWATTLHSATVLQNSDTNFDFSVLENGDLMAIKKKGTESGRTEVHILSAAGNYQNYSLQIATQLPPCENDCAYVTFPNRDLAVIRKKTGTGRTTVQVLTATSNYQNKPEETKTPLPEVGDNYAFIGMPNRDIVGMKKYSTDTKTSEVHVVSAESGYSKFGLETGTALPESQNDYDFSAAPNGDIIAIKKLHAESGKIEVHVLAASTKYMGFGIHASTDYPQLTSATDNSLFFAMPKNGDLFVVKKTSASTPKTELSVMSDYIQRFVPQLRFDRAANGYPMSAQDYYDFLQKKPNPFPVHENNNRETLKAGTIPTYYKTVTLGKQVRIQYWWFYGYQHPCDIDGHGSHHGDWEDATVILSEDRSKIAAVVYGQHGGHYTRISGPRDAPCTPSGTGRCEGSSGFDSDGTHPVIYIGKYGHGHYHNKNSAGPHGPFECSYYGDFRNPASNEDYLDATPKLVFLDGDAETWLAADRKGDFKWGPDGVSTHPTQRNITSNDRACTGSPTYMAQHSGCYKSECLAGDDQASEDCLKECRPGYDNAGLTCNKGKWPWDWNIYGRLNSGNKYIYDYILPTNDIGLVRRRATESEWSIP